MGGYYHSPPPPPPPACDMMKPPPPPPPPPPPMCDQHVPPSSPPASPPYHHHPPASPPYNNYPPSSPPYNNYPLASPPYYAPPPHFDWPSTPPKPPGGDHTVIIAVCVSLGGVFFLAFLAAGLFCLAKRKKKVIVVAGAAGAVECVDVEEHRTIEETVTTTPCGDETVTVTVVDDVHIHEVGEAAAGAALIGSPGHHQHHS